MTTQARHRLETELARIEYRERHARAILRVLAFVCASCAPRLRYERTEGTTEHFATEADRLSASEFPKLSEPNTESP